MCMLESVYKTIPFLPLTKLIFCFIYLGFDWLGIIVVFAVLLFQSFWNFIIISELEIIVSSLSICIIFMWSSLLYINVFDPWNVESWLLLKSWALASSLPFLKLFWKTTTSLALVTESIVSIKPYYELIICSFPQYNTALFVSASGPKMNQLGYFDLRFVLNLIPILNCALYFIWRLIDGLLSLLRRCQMEDRHRDSSLVMIDNTCQYVLKWVLPQ